MNDGTPDPPKNLRIPTWLGILLILGTVILAGAIGLLLERLMSARFR